MRAKPNPNRRRLVVCFDGTWNMRDDSTNVLHHFALAAEKTAADGIHQTKYYVQGVGTGVLDGVSGGAFGFGLEEKVREAYDWLVENFNDGDDLYLFGFSRGAYTARSLVGFISTCGIMRRGAPLSVNQLWQDYCVIGRQREHHEGFWDRLLGDAPPRIRRLNDLILDPWKIADYEAARKPQPDDGARIPGQLKNDLNDAERLLIRWSRRARIRYLGLYDTVGAMGLDALAIPGLRSKLALHHNMRPSVLIMYCRHALALDEHRTSFGHTPFLQYVGHGTSEESLRDNFMLPGADPVQHWKKQRAIWRNKIQQRWFVGAHSNIGGGYPDNILAHAPLRWLLEGARQAKLECEALPMPPVLDPAIYPAPRDSHMEFMAPVWARLIRGKRHYRAIAPYTERRAGVPRPDRPAPDGFSLQSINEQIDDTVFEHFERRPDYRPPNLIAFAKRRLKYPDVDPAEAARLKPIAERTSPHVWLPRIADHVVLMLWATLAAFGLFVMGRAMRLPLDAGIPYGLFGVAAFAFALVDWGESRQNHRVAAGLTEGAGRAFLASVYWLRTICFGLFALGLFGAVMRWWAVGWHTDANSIFRLAGETFLDWWAVPVLAGLGMVVANLLDGAPRSRQMMGLKAFGVGLGAVAGGYLVTVGLAVACRFSLIPLLGPPAPETVVTLPPETKLAALLLLLQAGLGVMLNAFVWVDEPISRINLGSIRALQFCPTPASVQRCLGTWVGKLACLWDPRDADQHNGPAAISLDAAVREALWRDLLGFIPLYTVVLMLGLWFGASQLHWNLARATYAGIPMWLFLPALAALADLVEDACHFRFLNQYRAKVTPGWALSLFSFVSSLLKFAAFTVAAVACLWAVLSGSWQVMLAGTACGWRGSLVLAVTVGSVLGLSGLLIATIYFRLRVRDKIRERAKPAR